MFSHQASCATYRQSRTRHCWTHLFLAVASLAAQASRHTSLETFQAACRLEPGMASRRSCREYLRPSSGDLLVDFALGLINHNITVRAPVGAQRNIAGQFL